jgi:RNA-directed DNA polymerase
MVVLAADTPKGRQWADRALMRIRQEAEAIGVSLNAEKTRLVTITEPGASFAFLGFEFRWERSSNTGRWYANRVPRPKKVIAVLQEVGKILRRSRHLPMQAAVAQVNPVLRGWVNYFRVGNSGQAFGKIKYEVECKVRRLAAKKCKRKGFGWKRWSSAVVYGTWGLFRDYRVVYWSAKACPG